MQVSSFLMKVGLHTHRKSSRIRLLGQGTGVRISKFDVLVAMNNSFDGLNVRAVTTGLSEPFWIVNSSTEAIVSNFLIRTEESFPSA